MLLVRDQVSAFKGAAEVLRWIYEYPQERKSQLNKKLIMFINPTITPIAPTIRPLNLKPESEIEGDLSFLMLAFKSIEPTIKDNSPENKLKSSEP